MKKNLMMRAASVLLVAVMLTTCAISGTFAKYVTSDNVKDSARVAKWGVTVTATGSLFGKTYLNASSDIPGADDADAATISVKSSNEDKVVAPGTKNATGITATVSGTPEVDVRVVVEVKGLAPDGTTEYESVKDIFLAEGTYDDMTTGKVDTFTVPAGGYYPVKFNLTQNGNPLVTNGKLSEVEAKLEALTEEYNAGADLATEVGTLNLTWTWDYGTAADTVADPWNLNITANDQADTLLGNLAVTPTLVDVAKYNLETGLEISILVEQID